MLNSIGQIVRSLGRALLLETEPYQEMTEKPNPFVEGLFIVALVGVVVAVAGLVGSVLTWASLPSLADMQQTTYQSVVRMPWYLTLAEQRGNEFVDGFQRAWQTGWRTVPALLGAPTPARAVFGLVLTPLALILSWLAYGVIAHLAALALRGRATLADTLGATSLAVAPQLALVFSFIPFFAAAGFISVWTLLCRYRAVKEAHDLPFGSALTATLLPMLLYYLGLVVLGVLAFGVLGAIVAGGQ